MSYPQGTKVRLVESWRAYSAGKVLEQGFYADMETLVKAGIAVRVDEIEEPSRPAKLAGKAAKKIADVAKGLFKP
jgi:hypothetical protein